MNLIHPTPLLCDNESARHIAHNHVFHERTKHVEMDCYFVRERVESKEITPICIHTHDQLADLLTKPLSSERLQSLSIKLGIRNLHAGGIKESILSLLSSRIITRSYHSYLFVFMIIFSLRNASLDFFIYVFVYCHVT